MWYDMMSSLVEIHKFSGESVVSIFMVLVDMEGGNKRENVLG